MNVRVKYGLTYIVLIGSIVLGLLAGDVFAAEGFHFTRALYDQMMRYLNFLILAVVAFKFGRKPIVNFLHGQKNEVAESIEQLENRRRDAEERIRKSREQLAHSQERLVRISQKIQAEGLKMKEKIIAQAQHESKIMIDTAQMKLQSYLREAVRSLKIEILDEATEKAIKKLPSTLVGDDHERLFHQWLEAVEHKLS